MKTRATPPKAKLPLNAAAHQPFSYLDPKLKNDGNAEFVEMVMDFAKGITLCLEMVNTSSLAHMTNRDAEPGEEELPLLSPCDTEQLLRFATASSNVLGRYAEERIEWMNEYRAKEAAK